MIGVFDSGVGGLTVHRALTERLPKADFLYLADQANTPYGGRSAEEIISLTQAGCEQLFKAGANLVVLACNTAAAIALHPLQQYWLPWYRKKAAIPLNIIGLIVPTIEAVTGMGWKDDPLPNTPPEGGGNADLPFPSPFRERAGERVAKVIGVFATPATVRSQVYPTEIHKRRPDISVVQEACPELARMIEAGAEREHLHAAIESHVQRLSQRIGKGPWQAILGCTHYEIVADIFSNLLPSSVRLIHQPTATADSLVRYLERHPEYPPGISGLKRFLTTGGLAQSALAQEFWGGALSFEIPLVA